MKTTVIESGKSTAKAVNANVTATAKAENGNVQKKVNGLPLSKEFDSKEKEEPKKAETPAQAKAQPTAETAKATATEKPKAEEQKQVLNLESTLKLVEDLHRRKVQRDKLLRTIDTLEEFEVAQLDDAEETDSNHFQGCELTIEDDERRTFSTKNPYIIKKVAEYINALCLDRLAEIECEIILPS